MIDWESGDYALCVKENDSGPDPHPSGWGLTKGSIYTVKQVFWHAGAQNVVLTLREDPQSDQAGWEHDCFTKVGGQEPAPALAEEKELEDV